MTYIALLRGINVSGQKRVPMADLKKVFETLKFTDVETYIQSGNVIFQYREWETGAMVIAIEKALKKQFDFEVEVIVRTAKEWPKIMKKNPFLTMKDADESKFYVTFLRDKMTKKNFPELEAYCKFGEEFVVAGSEIYLKYPAGFGKTKLTNQVFEKKLGTVATTRNWRTTLTLGEMCAGHK